MTGPKNNPRLMVGRAAVLSLLVGVLLVGASYAVTQAVSKPGLAHDLAMAGGVLLVAGLPGLVLAVVLTGRVRGGASLGFVAGIVVRLPVGGVVAAYGLHWGLAQTRAFSQAVAGMYLALLIVEVLCLVPAVKKTAASAPPVPEKALTPGSPGPQNEESV